MRKNTKVAIISGGMGGIGKAIAIKLAKDGFRIFLLYHKSPKNEASSFLHSLSGSGHFGMSCDLTEEKEIRDVVMALEKQMARVDICIHTAVSPLVRKRASDIRSKDFREQFEVTTFGGLNLFQAVIPIMKKQKQGRIIGLTTSAIMSEAPISGMVGYLCAKGALQSLLHDLSLELSFHNIMVNAVAPSFVPTKLHRDLPEKVLSFIVDRTKTNTAEEVAEVVSFLCSEKADTITGLSYPVGKKPPTKL